MLEDREPSVANRWILGAVVPLAICCVGVFVFWVMGSTRPDRVAEDGDDPVSRLMRIPAVAVSDTLPYPEDQPLNIEANGVVVPFRQITLATEVAGKIKVKSPNCQIGRFVKAGELLFAIDKTDYEWEIERLTAARDTERAQQKEWEQDVANAERVLKLSEEDLALQEKEIKRLENLPKGFASETELDQARKARLASQNQKLTIQNQLEALATRRSRTLLAERLVTAQLEQAKVNLARTEIRAPIAGVIMNESVEVDSYVQKGSALCVIEDTQHVEISCNLRPDQMTFILDQVDNCVDPKANEGSESYELPKTPVTVAYYVSGREDEVYEWQAHLSRYEGIGIDPQSRTVPVRITVENPREFKRRGDTGSGGISGAPTALVRGMFVDCVIHTNPRRPLALLPKLAFRPGNQVWQFVADDTVLTAPAKKDSGDKKISANESDGEKATIASAEAKSANMAEPKTATKAPLNPKDWKTGRLKIIDDVRVIRPYRSSSSPREEFWVIESQPSLKAGDVVITTPLATLQGDGSDLVRFEIKEAKE
jgi:multidrug efflux pump subunit AcrA (membrane-fusion protein)